MADGSINRAPAVEPWPSWVRRSVLPHRSVDCMRSISVVDLFSGCGGMTVGAREAASRLGMGINIRLAIDLDKNAIAVYRDNFGVNESVALVSDVRDQITGGIGHEFDATLRNLISAVGELDLLLAGPPCQGHSDLNNHSRRSDPRNSLYLSVVRAVEAFSPRFVIIENVPAVIHDRAGVTREAVCQLERLGYKVAERIVSLVEFGVPQRRRRHLMVASKVLTQLELIDVLLPRAEHSFSVRDFIGDLEDKADLAGGAFSAATQMSERNLARVRWLFENEAYDLPDSLRPACHRDRPHSYKSMYGRVRWDVPAQTITTGFGSMGQGRYVHPSRQRTLTCHEAARLQGFPDFFSFKKCESLSGLREMIGNAVPPQLGASVVKAAFGG